MMPSGLVHTAQRGQQLTGKGPFGLSQREQRGTLRWLEHEHSSQGGWPETGGILLKT